MKLNFSKWLRPASASTPELGDQLTQAEAQLQQASAAVEVAQAAFDAAGSQQTEDALISAQDVERRAQAHLDRAERLLKVAQERDEAEHRKQLEATAVSLEAELVKLRDESRKGPLVDAEVAALLKVLEARSNRWKLTARIDEAKAQLNKVNTQLGRPYERFVTDAPIGHFISERLVALAVAHPNDPRSRMLAALKPSESAYDIETAPAALQDLPPIVAGGS